MVTKKSKLPAEAIELYNVYIHGGVTAPRLSRGSCRTTPRRSKSPKTTSA